MISFLKRNTKENSTPEENIIFTNLGGFLKQCRSFNEEALGIDSEYDDSVKRFFNGEVTGYFTNIDIGHARSVVKYLVGSEKVENYIGIFDKEFDKKLWGTTEIVKGVLEKLIDKESNVRLKIIFGRDIDKKELRKNPFYWGVIRNEDVNHKVDLRILDEKEGRTKTNHIITINDRMFRIQPNIKDGYGSVSDPFFAANEPEAGKNIRKYFEELFLRSKEYKI